MYIKVIINIAEPTYCNASVTESLSVTPGISNNHSDVIRKIDIIIKIASINILAQQHLSIIFILLNTIICISLYIIYKMYLLGDLL